MISDMPTIYRSGKNNVDNVVLNSGGGEPGSLLARPDQTQTRAGQLGYKEVIFSQRVVTPWKSLPESLRGASNLNELKIGYDAHTLGRRVRV